MSCRKDRNQRPTHMFGAAQDAGHSQTGSPWGILAAVSTYPPGGDEGGTTSIGAETFRLGYKVTGELVRVVGLILDIKDMASSPRSRQSMIITTHPREFIFILTYIENVLTREERLTFNGRNGTVTQQCPAQRHWEWDRTSSQHRSSGCGSRGCKPHPTHHEIFPSLVIV